VSSFTLDYFVESITLKQEESMTESYGFLLADNGGQGAQPLPRMFEVKGEAHLKHERGFKL
jgi:hypothetical protein